MMLFLFFYFFSYINGIGLDSLQNYAIPSLNFKMVYTSKSPAKTYPNDQSMYKFLFSNINSIPDDQLIYMDVEDNNKSLTYRQVHTQILKCAAGMKKKWDIQYGDVVAICSPNQINYSIAVHGIVCAGMTTF